MDINILTALIAAGSAILGSAITGFVSYRITAKERNNNRMKHQLIEAYGDIIAFHRLEELYTRDMAQGAEVSSETVKRHYRRVLREAGVPSPSVNATALMADRRRSKLL